MRLKTDHFLSQDEGEPCPPRLQLSENHVISRLFLHGTVDRKSKQGTSQNIKTGDIKRSIWEKLGIIPTRYTLHEL